MKVQKTTLLMIASVVWFIAGVNVLKIGIESYENYLNLVNIVLSIVVFAIFWWMVFSKLVSKHTKRIEMMEDKKHLFIHFFDRNSFVIMAIMMIMGIGIRVFNLAPQVFIAVFYSGLGSALALAGIFFMVNYLKLIIKN